MIARSCSTLYQSLDNFYKNSNLSVQLIELKYLRSHFETQGTARVLHVKHLLEN